MLYFTLQLWSILIISAHAVQVTFPKIDFESLDTLGMTSAFGGISFFKDSQQLTQIPESTSSMISQTNDTLQLLASTYTNETIYDACVLQNTLYFAGNFTTINNIYMNNIASLDLQSNQIQPLEKGLDGPVFSVHCDEQSNSVFVGGIFVAPIANSPIDYSNSLASFGGGVAVWKSGQWQSLPWKGFNGPVRSILRNLKTNTLIFGGHFDTTLDDQTTHAPASQPISLIHSVTATNSSSLLNDPSSVLCSTPTNSKPWLLSDGVSGTWQATFDTNLTPTLIRLSNSRIDGHQTKGFGIRPITSNTGSGNYYNLSYIDPITGYSKQCTSNCVLTSDPNVLYQDFRITDQVFSNGIAIDIFSWYGRGAGLSVIEMFQSEIFTYAVEPSDTKSCILSTNLHKDKVIASGVWNTIPSSHNPHRSYLSTVINSLNPSPSLTLTPNLAESGFYEILLYVPACSPSSDCNSRLDVDVAIKSTMTQTTVVTISQVSASDTSLSIFKGYFDLANFQPTIDISLAHNIPLSQDMSASIVVDSVQFVKHASRNDLISILEYNVAIKTPDITQDIIPWGSLQDKLPFKTDIVNSMVLYNDNLYIGGLFSSADQTASRYNNIVCYDTTIKKLKALKFGGPNGPVTTLLATNTGDLYVGGSFTGLFSTTTNMFSNIAKYNIIQGTWIPLLGGVNGPVNALNFMENEQSILVSGKFNQLLSPIQGMYPNTTSGNAWWNLQDNTWRTDTAYLSGTVYSGFSKINHDSGQSKNYFFGSIQSAQRYQTNGMAYINSNATHLVPLPFYPQKPFSVSTGALYQTAKSPGSIATVLGGEFQLPGNIQNLAIYNNGSWFGVDGADWKGGSIHTMAINNNLLYVGGRFSGTRSKNLAIFNLVDRSFYNSPDIRTKDGSPANVRSIRYLSNKNGMVIGGKFNSIGPTICPSVCYLDPSTLQWNPLGNGLDGEVFDIQLVDGKLFTAGNLTLNNIPLYVAQYNFDQNVWLPLASQELPGPSNMLSYDNAKKNLYIAGQVNSTSYLKVWDGQKVASLASELGPGSIIRHITCLPLNTLIEQNVLLATGYLNIDNVINVSAAFYDGKNWIPYLVSSSGSDVSQSMGSILHLAQPLERNRAKNYLPTPIVILAAIAVSLGVVFLIVLTSMVILYFKRQREAKINPETNPSSFYGKAPRDPQTILASLQNTSTGISNDINNEKSPVTESFRFNTTSPDNNKEYDDDIVYQPGYTETSSIPPLPRSKSQEIMTRDHFYHDQNSKESDFHSYPTTRHSSMPATQLIIDDNGYFIPSRATTEEYNSLRKSKVESTTALAIAAISAADRELPSLPPYVKQQDEKIFKEEEEETANLSTSKSSFDSITLLSKDDLQVNKTRRATDPQGSTIYWTNTHTLPTVSTRSMILSHVQDSNNKLSSNSIQTTKTAAFSQSFSEDPDIIRWTTAPSECIAVAQVVPISLTERESIISGSDQRNSGTRSQYQASLSSVAWPYDMDYDYDPDKEYSSRGNSINSLPINATSIVDEYRENTETSNYETEDTGNDMKAEEEDDEVYEVVALNKNEEKKVENELVELEEEVSIMKEEEDKNSIHAIHHVNEEVINPNAFRLSDTGSLPALDPIATFDSKQHKDIPQSPTDLSSIRWKVANMGSSIETAFTPNLIEPASVSVTRRSAAEKEEEANKYQDRQSRLESFLSPKTRQRTSTAVTTRSISSTQSNHTQGRDSSNSLIDVDSIHQEVSESDKEVNDGQENESDTNSERHIVIYGDYIDNEDQDDKTNLEEGTTTENLVVGMVLLEETEETEENLEESSHTKNKNTDAHINMDNEDGISTDLNDSKRLVQERLLTGDKSKAISIGSRQSNYNSDFKSVAAKAFLNNAKSEPASEENPHLYYAKFNFYAREHGELGFMKKDTIIVVDESDDIWWMGYRTDADGLFIQGVFPSNYVELATEIIR